MKITIRQPQIIHELGSRSNQEDSVFPTVNKASEDNCVFILCDGMGGHENGEVASQLVCQELSEYIEKNWDGGVFSEELFYTALDEVFLKINEYDSDSFRKMGTTLTFLCLNQGGALMAHIGDSRIYHIRPSEHLILYKSRDHSLAYDLYMAEEISYEELTTYKKNVITRAIMPGMDRQPKADIVHSTDIQDGDYFFLCSDGMLEQMSDDDLLDILSSDMSDEKKREILIEKTKDNKDNHSAFILQIENVAEEGQDFSYVNDESTSRSNAILLEKTPSGLKKESNHNQTHSLKSSNNSLLNTFFLIVIIFVVLILIIKNLL